jgi:hypothetical protein
MRLARRQGGAAGFLKPFRPVVDLPLWSAGAAILLASAGSPNSAVAAAGA